MKWKISTCDVSYYSRSSDIKLTAESESRYNWACRVLCENLQNFLGYQMSSSSTSTPIGTISQAAVKKFSSIDVVAIAIALFCFVFQNQSRFGSHENSYGKPLCRKPNSLYHLGGPRESEDSNIYKSDCSAHIDIHSSYLRVCWIKFLLFIS